MKQNYLFQLKNNYPDKEELLRWINVKLDRIIYFYGPSLKSPRKRTLKQSIYKIAKKYYLQLHKNRHSYYGAVICEAYFHVGKYVEKEGFKVELPPWTTGCLSPEGMKTISSLSLDSDENLNYLISEEFTERVYKLKEELRNFFIVNKTPFVLLANGEQPIYRIVIDLCKEINVPTGVFLHGLPARYSLDDNYHADYLFVWGEKIKENFQRKGCKSKIVVTGHPIFSQYKKKKETEDNVVVLTQSISYTHCSNDYVMEDVGMTIQYIYTVENVLKRLGYKKAILRPHPGEDPNWYKKRMDTSFFTIDTNSLEKTIGNAKFIVGPTTTVVLDAVYSNIPYYVFIIDSITNSDTAPVVPPFTHIDETPVSYTEEDLYNNIRNHNSATIKNFDGYVQQIFDISKITGCIQTITKQ